MPVRTTLIDAIAILPIRVLVSDPMSIPALTGAIFASTLSHRLARRKGEANATADAGKAKGLPRPALRGGILTRPGTMPAAPMLHPRRDDRKGLLAILTNAFYGFLSHRSYTSLYLLSLWQHYDFLEILTHRATKLYA